MWMEIVLMLLVVVYAAAIVFNKIYTKVLLSRIDPVALVFWTNVFSAVLMLPFVGFTPLITISTEGWVLIMLGGMGWAVSGVLTNISTQKADLSLREPALALRVPLISLASVIFLHEVITFTQVLATLCIMMGIIVVSYERTLWTRDRSTLYWLSLSIVITAIVVVVDKVASLTVTGYVYVFFMFLIPALLQGVWYRRELLRTLPIVQKEWSSVLLIATVLVVCYWVYIVLLSRLPLSFIYPIMQACSILVVFYGVYFLKERSNAKHRLIGAAIAALGVVFFHL